MNRLELMMSVYEYHDPLHQPYKDKGIYIYEFATLIMYGVTLSEKKMMKIAGDMFASTDDGTYYEDTRVYFIHVKKGKEEVLIPLIREETLPKNTITIIKPFEEDALSIKKSKKYLKRERKAAKLRRLEGVANYVSIDGLMGVFAASNMDSFIDEHYGKLTTQTEIIKKYRELAKIHHPDAGGKDVIFRAITRAKEYLLNKGEINNEKLV